MTRKRFVVAPLTLVALSWCSSCAPEALPREHPDQLYGQAMQRAELAAQDARRASAEAKQERERSTQLLAEVKALVARLEAAERRCADQVGRLSKAEDNRRREARKKADHVKHEQAMEAAAPSPSPTPEKPKDPEYSPSDAPLSEKPAAPPASAAPAPSPAHGR